MKYEERMRRLLLREDIVPTFDQVVKFGTPKPEGTYAVCLLNEAIIIYRWVADSEGYLIPSHRGCFLQAFRSIELKFNKARLFLRVAKLLNLGDKDVWLLRNSTLLVPEQWESLRASVTSIEKKRDSENV